MSMMDGIIRDSLGSYEILFRIVFSAFLGFIIGLDRTQKHKPAGVKTYMYVALASTLVTIISIESVRMYAGYHEKTVMDPMRLTAQVVAGLGFIGAGIILKDGAKIIGLTSAAMVLFVGGIGIGIGTGLYSYVIVSYVISILFVKLGNYIEYKEKIKEQMMQDHDHQV